VKALRALCVGARDVYELFLASIRSKAEMGPPIQVLPALIPLLELIPACRYEELELNVFTCDEERKPK
jgi:hypothetical protein